MECWHLKYNPYLVFDYLLRIGYVRNIVLPLEKRDMVLNLCKYAGWNQMMSLKNNIGLSMAYVAGRDLGSMKEHISLYAMEEKAKKEQLNALDKVLKEEDNHFTRLMAMFPFVRLSHNKDNESRSYYSVIALLAVIGDLLKCTDREEMIGRINDLKLFRSYQMPQEEDYYGEDDGIGGDDYGVETRQEEIVALADMMFAWKSAYKDCLLPPYALGRMMTRLYTSLSKVIVNNVGHMMNVMIANFFNSCLIEETRIRIPAAEQGKINNSNLRSDTRYFKDNLGKADLVNKLTFTKWMMACPMLNCFLDEETYGKLQECLAPDFKKDRKTYPVFELLCVINSKDVVAAEEDVRPSFSGEKTVGWRKTLDALRSNGVPEDMIQEKIIDEEDTDKALEFIIGTGLFKNVKRGSVESFRENLQQQEGVVEAEPPHLHENPEDGNE